MSPSRARYVTACQQLLALGVVCSPFVQGWYQTITLAPIFYGLFILVVLLMPKGIVGLPAQLRAVFARRKAAEAEPAALPEKKTAES